MAKAKTSPAITTATTTMAANPYQTLLEGQDPVRVLAATPKRLAKLVAGLTTAQLRRRPAPDRWSVHEIVAHLADVEMVYGARCRWVLFEDNPQLFGFAQEAWVDGWRREKEPLAETLERFRVLRGAQVRLFRGASAEDLQRTGTHEERGEISLGYFLNLLAGHDVNHLRQLAEVKGQLLGTK